LSEAIPEQARGQQIVGALPLAAEAFEVFLQPPLNVGMAVLFETIGGVSRIPPQSCRTSVAGGLAAQSASAARKATVS